jgi:hypothetical protein
MQVMEIESGLKNKRTRMGNGKRWSWEMEKSRIGKWKKDGIGK